MKKLLFTKISKDTVYLFLLLGLSLGLIVWTIQAVNYLDYVTQDGHGLKTYFLYSILNFPKIIHRMIPFIFFIAVSCWELRTKDFPSVGITFNSGLKVACKSLVNDSNPLNTDKMMIRAIDTKPIPIIDI